MVRIPTPRQRSRIALATLSAVTLLTVVACGDDNPVADSSQAVATSGSVTTPPTTVVTAEQTATTAVTADPSADPSETTTTPPASAATTAPPAPVGWATVAEMPSVAYIPCCGSNLFGATSPEVPDPTAPLPAGLFRATRLDDGTDPTSVTMALRRLLPCSDPAARCEDGYVDGDVGTPDEAFVEVTLPLDATVDVVVGGFACTADGSQYVVDHQAATGAEFAALQAEFDAAYVRTVAPTVAAGMALEEYATAFATPIDGFGVPCQFAGVLQFTPSAGPGILLQTLGRFDDATSTIEVPTSISATTITLTAIEVGDDGRSTLFFYAGFLS